MDIGKMRRFFLTAIMAGFTFLLSYAQPSIKTTVDKNEILIGDQFKLKIAVKDIEEGYKITWPVIPDSLQHFEVVNRGKIDSSYQDKKLTAISQTITLTSFDSGKWVLPSFLVNVDPLKDDTTYNFFTDSVPVTVSFFTKRSPTRKKGIQNGLLYGFFIFSIYALASTPFHLLNLNSEIFNSISTSPTLNIIFFII